MIMKRFISCRLVTWALAAILAIPFYCLAAEKNPTANLKLDATAISRDVRSGNSYAEVIKKASPSVVTINATQTIRIPRSHRSFGNPFLDQFFGDDQDSGNRGGRSLEHRGVGSGVIVTEDGYILTNNHVVDGADDDGIEVLLEDGKKKFDARIVGTDPKTDLALLKIEGKGLPAITLADSDRLEVGDVVLAIGNPFDLGKSVSLGIVSALGRGGVHLVDYEDFIQTDAAINKGNSGGALVDAQGRLIGINQSIASTSGANSGVGFAVPVNLARSVMEQLVEHGAVKRGFLGVLIQEVTPELAKAFDLPDTSGALISSVGPETPAAGAGLMKGDVIVEVNGKKASDSQHTRLMISQNRPGSKISLAVIRDGKERAFTAQLAELPSGEVATFGGTRSLKNIERDALDGVEVDDLTTSVRREAGIPTNIKGALVTDVNPESNAYEAGLRPGVVIQDIDRKPVESANEAVELSAKAKGEQILLRVWGQRGDMNGSRYLTVDNTRKK